MGDRAKSRVCVLLSQLIALGLLLVLIPSGYLTFEYYLKPWGEQQLKKYAGQVSMDNITKPELGGNGATCIKCIGINTVYPVTSTSHPTYSSFQVALINNGGWFTSMLTSAGVAIGGGGSLLFTILNLAHGVQGPPAHSTTSSTAYNGAGIFEMVFLVNQAQFMTMLGAMQLDGLPLFFLEYSRKLAWTNLLIFPRETSYTPVTPDKTRRLLSLAGTTGVERYSELVGVKPHHLFYYTCIALAVALGAILVIYGILRLIIAAITKDDTPKTLDHRVIWVFLQLLVLMQYIVATTASFQIYMTISTNRSLGDIGLAIVFLSLVCIGVMVFGIIKIARHRDLVNTHGTPAYDEKKPFHLRYSVYYQDYRVNNIYFFVVKMLLDIACGAIVGTVQSPSLQIGIMVALNALYLFLLIGRKPYLVPLFYSVSVFTGFLRIIILMLTLVHTQDNKFPQDTRDLAAVWIIGLNIALLVAVLIRQFYTLSVAIYKWASRPKPATDDPELGIPLQELPHKSKLNQNEENETRTDVPSKWKSSSTNGTKRLATKKKSSRPSVSPPSDDTLFASQPYRELSDRDTMDGYTTGTSTDSTTRSSRTKGGGRRSFYSHERNRVIRQKKLDAVKDENLPTWAQV